jgi:para-nitrobenzyl esterase
MIDATIVKTTYGPLRGTKHLGGARVQARWLNFAAVDLPIGLLGEPRWPPYRSSDRACLVIERRDQVLNDLDRAIRAMRGGTAFTFA